MLFSRLRVAWKNNSSLMAGMRGPLILRPFWLLPAIVTGPKVWQTMAVGVYKPVLGLGTQ